MPEPPDEPRQPQRPAEPLPRLVRFRDPDEPSDDAAHPGRGSRRQEPDPLASEPGKALETPTPRLDTVETRQRVRTIVGLTVLGVVLLAGWFGLRGLWAPAEPLEAARDESLPAVAPPTGQANQKAQAEHRAQAEQEAMIGLEDAHVEARNGDIDRAVTRLQAVVKHYPQSRAAIEARAALDRVRDGLPLFSDVPVVLALPPSPPEQQAPSPEPMAPETIVATTTPPEAGVGNVTLTPPAVPPEPHHPTGLPEEIAAVPPRPLPAGFRPRPDVGTHPTGWPQEITTDCDGSTMRLVPGGSFPMGRNDGEPQERPAHLVTLAPFYFDQHEVTVGQYRRFLQAAGRDEGPSSDDLESLDPDRPITRVSAYDALAFAQWSGKSLPTEAQWELAARTTDGRLHPWGGGQPAWTTPREPGQIDPVMSHPLDCSPYGVFDLAGNASEWTCDHFLYYERFAHPNGLVDPLVRDPERSRGANLAIKGTSADWLVSRRADMTPGGRRETLGFRCVLNIEGEPTPVTTTASPRDRPVPPRPTRGLPRGVVPF